MLRTIIYIATAFITAVIPTTAEEIRQLEWKDLIPAHLQTQDPLAGLTLEQKDLVIWVINMLETLPKRGPETEEFYIEIDKAMPSLKEAGVDIQKVMEKRNEMRTAIVRELDGKKVRLPGYLLPLEVMGANVTEFLLVPWIGACIHTPPPPPNQILYVKIIKGGYRPKGLYDPVWVTGKMTVQSQTRDLFLVDGSADIDIGYSIAAEQVQPYK